MGFQKYDVFVKQGAYHNPKMTTNTGKGGAKSTRTLTGRTASEIVVTLAIDFLKGWLAKPGGSGVGGVAGGAGAGGEVGGGGGVGGRSDGAGGSASSPWLLHVCFKGEY